MALPKKGFIAHIEKIIRGLQFFIDVSRSVFDALSDETTLMIVALGAQKMSFLPSSRANRKRSGHITKIFINSIEVFEHGEQHIQKSAS